MFIDLLTAVRLEAAQAWRATYYAEAQLEQQPDPQGATLSLAGGQIVYAGPEWPVNRAIGLGLTEPVVPATLEAVEEFYAVRQAPPRIDLCPLADRHLVELLAERNYAVEKLYTVLVQPLPSPQAATTHDPIRVTEATLHDVERWLLVVGQGFDEQAQPSAETLAMLRPNILARNAHAYFAWIGDEPAGGGGKYLFGEVAEFGGASTRPGYRRRGVQRALLRHRLAAAHALGCDLALTLTTPGTASQRNIQRLGFAIAYTKAVMQKRTA